MLGRLRRLHPGCAGGGREAVETLRGLDAADLPSRDAVAGPAEVNVDPPTRAMPRALTSNPSARQRSGGSAM